MKILLLAIILVGFLCIIASANAQKEIIVEQSISYGNYILFGTAEGIKIYETGIEYDFLPYKKHLLDAKLNYSIEAEPALLMNEPTNLNQYGQPSPTVKNISNYFINENKRQTLYGIGIAPLGFRLMWRSDKRIKPYGIAKGVIVVFDKKAISSQASYLNFSAQFGFGLQIRINQKIDLRFGLANDTHISNAYIVPVNPGLDVLNSSFGVSYHF